MSPSISKFDFQTRRRTVEDVGELLYQSFRFRLLCRLQTFADLPPGQPVNFLIKDFPTCAQLSNCTPGHMLNAGVTLTVLIGQMAV